MNGFPRSFVFWRENITDGLRPGTKATECRVETYSSSESVERSLHNCLTNTILTKIIQNKCIIEPIPAKCSVALVVSYCEVELLEFCSIRNPAQISQNMYHGLVEICLSGRVWTFSSRIVEKRIPYFLFSSCLFCISAWRLCSRSFSVSYTTFTLIQQVFDMKGTWLVNQTWGFKVRQEPSIVRFIVQYFLQSIVCRWQWNMKYLEVVPTVSKL